MFQLISIFEETMHTPSALDETTISSIKADTFVSEGSIGDATRILRDLTLGDISIDSNAPHPKHKKHKKHLMQH